MKKVFFQFGIGIIYWILPACIVWGGGGVSLIVNGALRVKPFGIVFGGIMLVTFTIFLWMSIDNRIIFFDEKIYVSGEKYPKFLRAQYKDEILYSRIETIRIIYSCKSSKKKNLDSSPLGYQIQARTFFEFILNNRRKKWVHITYFSKKQRIKMIDIINEKTGLSLSYDQMLKESKYTKKSRE